jgi:hypothetical protein
MKQFWFGLGGYGNTHYNQKDGPLPKVSDTDGLMRKTKLFVQILRKIGRF